MHQCMVSTGEEAGPSRWWDVVQQDGGIALSLAGKASTGSACNPITARDEVGMVQSRTSTNSFPLGRLVIIAAVAGVAAIGFAYTAGWLSPQRLTPKKIVAALAPPGGPALGYRRNHAKGICFTGTFDANGEGSALSKAPVFVRGQYPIVGRFNLGTPNPNAGDSMVRVRGL